MAMETLALACSVMSYFHTPISPATQWVDGQGAEHAPGTSTSASKHNMVPPMHNPPKVAG